MRIEVTRPSASGPLYQYVWGFWFDHVKGHLVLDYYAHIQRKSPRHKWTQVLVYNRLSHTQRYVTAQGIQEEDVPLPDDVKAEAKTNFILQVVVRKHKEKVT
jgi:hypothetical protein